MKRILIIALSFFTMTLSVKLQAQTQEELWQQLLEDDLANMEALALYPEDTRLHLLEAAKYPEALIRLQTMQARTQAAFRTLVEAYPDAVQRKVWDLTRYPGLIERLVGEGRGSRAAVRQILQEYPVEAHETALDMSDEQFGLLARIDDLERNADSDFRRFAADYPERTQAALRALVELPEVLTILTDNVKTTVMLGDLYKRDPYNTLQRFNSLNLAVARERARELESWKQNLEQDPEARRELEQSAQAYSKEYGYDDNYYNYAPVERPQRVIVEHHYYHPYRYWFGYPYWYAQPRWRPVPYWYDYGFYMQPGGVIVVFGFPSHYFVNWYYRRPYNVYRYPRVGNRFADFYYGNRRSTTTIVIGVENWKRRNADVVSDAWLSDRNGRVDRLREFGQMEEAREIHNRDNPGRQLPQREFVTQNAREYPRLNERLPDPAPRTEPRRDAVTPQPRSETPRTQQPVERPRTEPVRETPRTQQPVERPRTEPVQTPRTQQPVERPRTEPIKETPRTQPAERPRTEPIKETPRTQPAERPRTEPVKETPRTQPAERSRTEPVREAPRTQPAERPRTEPIKETPRTQQAERPRAEPVREAPRTQPVEKPRTEPQRTQPAAEKPRTEVRKETPARKDSPAAKPAEKTKRGN
jgi:hypothetical protein